jgi:hypothetical protein
MTRNFITFCIVFFIFSNYLSYAQLSGYASGGYSYNSNPLYSYIMKGSKSPEGYVELNYDKEFEQDLLNIKYVGGLYLFTNNADSIQYRNYYEHRLSGTYKFVFPNKNSDDDSDEAATDSTNVKETFNDSTSNYLDIGITGGARHDRDIFKEFNNLGGELLLSYRFMLLDLFYLRITDIAGYRYYPNIEPLSNANNLFTLLIGNKNSQYTNYGLYLSAGIKHYTHSFFDSTAVDTSNIVTAQPNIQLQLTPGMFLKQKVGTTEFQPSLLYHYNLRKSVRFIDITTRISFLNEDLYNDSYGYEGFDGSLNIKQSLFFNINASLELEFQQKKFGYPAWNLAEIQVSDKRYDLHSSAELYLSRYFQISNSFGCDITLDVGYQRNQSNDGYNDFYVYNYGLYFGIGF